MLFPYEKYPVPGRKPASTASVYRPMIRIVVIGPNRSDSGTELALLDTGADDTLIPDVFAGFYGVALDESARVDLKGLGSGFSAIFARVDLLLIHGDERHRWCAEVGFHKGYDFILGHIGFLQYFEASFDGPGRQVTLTLRAPPPPPEFLESPARPGDREAGA